MKYTLLLGLAILQAVLGIVLWYKRHDRVSRVFAYLTFALLFWTVVNSLLDYQTTTIMAGGSVPGGLTTINILNTVGFVSANIILFLLYESTTAALDVHSGRIPRKLLVMASILVALSVFPIVSGSYTFDDGTLTYHYGPAALLLVPYYLLLCWFAVRAALNKLKSNQSVRERRQALTMLAALFLSGAWALLFIIIIPFLTQNDKFIFVGYLAPYIFTILMYYGIIWLGFLNFRQIVARSIGYMLSLVGLGAVFILSINLVIGFFFQDELSAPENLSLTAIGFVVAISFQPAKRFFDRITSRVFYRDIYNSQALFNLLNKVLVSSIDLQYTMNRCSMVIAENLRPQFCVIGLAKGETDCQLYGENCPSFEPQDVARVRKLTTSIHKTVIIADLLEGSGQDLELQQLLQKNNVAALVRLTESPRKNKDGLGYIVLGPKKSGGPYSLQDTRTLEGVANGLVIAIQNALHFEEIQQFNVTLQARVDEATRKLRVTNEKLKKLDETKDEFISMASHQLRTPLTSVKGYLSMVLEGDAGKLKPQQEALLKQSFLSSQRMVNLIADLLNLSRINTGKFVIDASPTDLRTVVEAEMAQLQESAKAKNITMVYECPESFPTLMLDENKIHQVVMNFMDNAVYYTPDGGQITISLVETPTAVEYRVKDSGIGVPREMQRHLFTKFYRADNARRMRPDGTGLGIYMAKKVILAQGGTIIFESEEGKGSTFGFRFPKQVRAVDAALVQPPAVSAEQTQPEIVAA